MWMAVNTTIVCLSLPNVCLPYLCSAKKKTTDLLFTKRLFTIPIFTAKSTDLWFKTSLVGVLLLLNIFA